MGKTPINHYHKGKYSIKALSKCYHLQLDLVKSSFYSLFDMQTI